MFESIIVTVVNKYLGKFVENLDSSQLSIGLLGGDVVLNNLYIKEGALDDLDLPVKVRYGLIGKLTLKVPWKNIYSESTVAILDGLYVLAVPNTSMTYNAEKEEAAAWSRKQQELERLELVKASLQQKGPKEQTDSFAEKLASGIIKNLEVNISNIHIRYEHIVKEKVQFSLGISLRELSLHTTNSQWVQMAIKDDKVSTVFKIMKLDSLAVYWNSTGGKSYLKLDKKEWFSEMLKNVASASNQTDYAYLVEPISAEARLQLHAKPSVENFTIPKILLNIAFQEISVILSRNQYQNILELLTSFDQIAVAFKYQKYKPSNMNKKLRWQFAYKCVLEEDVKRRRNMWSWTEIKRHRTMLKEYKAAYKRKLQLQGGKIPSDLNKQLEKCERALNVFNISLARNQAEQEVVKEGSVKKETKPTGGGWFSSWFGGGNSKQKEEAEKAGEIVVPSMTAEEKAKLNEALSYQETMGDVSFPIEYEANKVSFTLNKLAVKLITENGNGGSQLLKSEISRVDVTLTQRPAGKAIKVLVKTTHMAVAGLAEGDQQAPPMVSVKDTQGQQQGRGPTLLDVVFETQPLDKKCDTRIVASLSALEIIYHAKTINQLTTFFTPPKSVKLLKLQEAAMSKFEELKEQSATGLQFLIQQRKYTDISIELQPSYIIVPELGEFHKDCRFLLLDIGKLKVITDKLQADSTPKSPHQQLSLDEMKDKAYDKFGLNLSSVQVLYVQPGTEWQKARQQPNSSMHILQPMALGIDLFKCMVEDVRLPKMKVRGELPSLTLSLSDDRVREVTKLLESLPPGEKAEEEEEDTYREKVVVDMTARDTGNMLQTLVEEAEDGEVDEETGQVKQVTKTVSTTSTQKGVQREYANLIDLEAHFLIKEITVNVSKNISKKEMAPLLKLSVHNIGLSLQSKTFDLTASAYMAGIYLQYLEFKAKNGTVVNIISSTAPEGKRLLEVGIVKANRKAPDFASTYKNTAQRLTVRLHSLEFMLHLEAILNLMAFVKTLMPPEKPQPVSLPRRTSNSRRLSVSSLGGSLAKGTHNRYQTPRDDNVIDTGIEASMEVLRVSVSAEDKPVTDIKILGLAAAVVVMKSRTSVVSTLQDLCIFDPTSKATYPRIVSAEGKEQMVRADVVVYNREFVDSNNQQQLDTKVSLKMGRTRVVFLNKFVSNVLKFVNNFEEAKKRVLEAGSKVADSAVTAAQSLHEKASRIGLDIEVVAPQVFIPQNSSSTMCLIADLGHVKILNRMQVLNHRSQSGENAVLDQMTVELTELKLSRAVVNGLEVKAECLLLEPLSLQLLLTRSLCAAWYHGHPEIEINGQLHNTVMSLSHDDYVATMFVLNENLAEGAPPKDNIDKIKDAEDPASVHQAQTADDRLPSSIQTAPAALALPATAKADVEPLPKSRRASSTLFRRSASHSPDKAGQRKAVIVESPGVYDKLKLAFKIANLSLTLFVGRTELTQGVAKRDNKKSLGRIELQSTGVVCVMRSDDSMSASVDLEQCLVTDTRIETQSGITRVIERSSRSKEGGSSNSMIAVKYEQEVNKTDITAGLYGLCVSASADYLMTLMNFFTKGLPQTKPGKTKPATTAKSPSTAGEVVPASTDSPPARGEFHVRVTIEEPEIILAKDSKTIDSEALIVRTNVEFALQQVADAQNLSGTVARLTMVSCLYAPDKRKDSEIVILNPTEFSLQGNAPAGRGLHLNLLVSDIIMYFSPAIIRNVSAILSNFSAPTEEEGKDEDRLPTGVWDVKEAAPSDELWYLNPEVAEDAMAVAEAEDAVKSRDEQLIMAINKIVIHIQGGVGGRIPFLIVESSFNGDVRDWSTKMIAECDMSVEVGYYNEKLAVWEPLLEEIEDESQSGSFQPWSLHCTVQKNAIDVTEDVDEIDGAFQLKPKMSVNVTSKDIMQLTLTSTSLDVLNNLSKAFGDAFNLVDMTDSKEVERGPYMIRNILGMDITVDLNNYFTATSEKVDSVTVKSDERQVLNPLSTGGGKTLVKKSSVIKLTNDESEVRVIKVSVPQFPNVVHDIAVNKAIKRMLPLGQKDSVTWYMLCQVNSDLGSKIISFRSIVKVQNHLACDVELFYKTLHNQQFRSCGLVSADSKFHLPLDAVHAPGSEVYIRPKVDNYKESNIGINWKAFSSDYHPLLSCPNSENSLLTWTIAAFVEAEWIGDEMSQTSPEMNTFVIHLRPSVILTNLLPYTITINTPNSGRSTTLDGGSRQPMLSTCLGEDLIQVTFEYLGKMWVGTVRPTDSLEELSPITFSEKTPADGSSPMSTDLGLRCMHVQGGVELFLFCPYWVVNRTGRLIRYKDEDDYTITHGGDFEGFMLFSYKVKKFSSKKKVSLQIGDSDWSEKFSLDAVGSTGIVTCKFQAFTSQVGVRISLATSCFGLTKIITFTPYYMLINRTPFSISCKESGDLGMWYDIPSGECIPCWPTAKTQKRTMVAKVTGTTEQTKAFSFADAHTTLLQLNTEHVGLMVECQIMESGIEVSFDIYKAGCAVVQLVNYVHASQPVSIEFEQSGVADSQLLLKTGQSQLYTWYDPLGERELVWSCGQERKHKIDLVKDGYGDFFYDNDVKVYWVSFLNGMQRTLLFTEDNDILYNAVQAGELERVDFDFQMGIEGIGLSLVNSNIKREVAYVSITSSGVIWEEKSTKKHNKRFKKLPIKLSEMLEEAYQKYQEESRTGKRNAVRSVGKAEVDFCLLAMIKPHQAFLNRKVEEGLWFQYSTSEHQIKLHSKLHRLQIDCQLPAVQFQTVLAPVPPPKSVLAESIPKPFIECSVVIRKRSISNVLQFKYCMVLVQEMAVKVDQAFLKQIIAMFASKPPTQEEVLAYFPEDSKQADVPLMELALMTSAQEQKHFYDSLELSPLKIHVTFSMYGGDGGQALVHGLQTNMVQIFLQSVGVVLTDIQDVVFKMGSFRQEYVFLNKTQLTKEISRHYTQQALKQMYVVVLGLDVLGNPYSVVTGVAHGVRGLFYEPFQGAVLGPQEFAEGLAIGVHGFLGSAVGGVSGALSRITGALGKGIATLSFDEEYQRKRREQQAQPVDIKEGLARGGKGLVMGLFEGVTGVVMKPVQGAQQEGAKGFFKGVGKGLVGVVTRPAGGVVDFASTSFAGIRRIAEMSEEVHRLRPPRFVRRDGVVTPFTYFEAEGNEVLQEVNKGMFAKSDMYVCHAVVKDTKNVLLVTDRRVVMAKKGDVLGHWNSEWAYVWEDIREWPTYSNKGITSKGGVQVMLKEVSKSFFMNKPLGHLVNITDPVVGQWIVDKMCEAMRSAKAN